MRRTLSYPTLGLLLSAAAFAETKLPAPATFSIDFDKHVQPILAEKCFGCHGARQQQSGLRLDKRQNALRGGDYGPVILPGRSSESKLILRLVDGDGGLQMPPTGALSAEDIGILRAWIDQGGEYGDVEAKDPAPEAPVDPQVRALIAAVRAHDDKAVERMIESIMAPTPAQRTASRPRRCTGRSPTKPSLWFCWTTARASTRARWTAAHQCILRPRSATRTPSNCCSSARRTPTSPCSTDALR